MDAGELKDLLQNFDTILTRIKLAERYAYEKKETAYYENKRKAEILNDIINSLCEEERFIIQTHLVCHRTWTETTELYAKQFGYEKEKSERTLKRFQNKAVNKMLDLINHTSAGQYLSDIKEAVK